jgi:hypothetical protein
MVIAAATPANAQAPPPAARDAAAFAQRPAAEQEQILARLRAALARDPSGLDSAIAALAAAAGGGTERVPRLPTREAKELKHSAKKAHARPEAAAMPVPTAVRYVFGLGVIEPSDAAAQGSKNDKNGKNGKKARADQGSVARHAAFEAAALGMHPDAGAALAELLRRLDQDPGGDRFAAFLHAWRDGSESFYEALDRTAGTPEAVFYYDAMLGDFCAQFADKDSLEAAELRRSLDAAHDAVHAAFLSYRQYRAFREALGLALVLPPDQPLPARLARYEAKVPGGYSLRQQAQMALAALDYDPARVVAAFAERAAPLPRPIWSGQHDPYPAWNEVFAGLQPRMIEAAGDTDAFLARADAQLRAIADAHRKAAQASLEAAAVAKTLPRAAPR